MVDPRNSIAAAIMVRRRPIASANQMTKKGADDRPDGRAARRPTRHGSRQTKVAREKRQRAGNEREIVAKQEATGRRDEGDAGDIAL